MSEDLERLKQSSPLLQYLQQHNWSGRPAEARSEFVRLCPLHEETHSSFFVNPRENLFYCHGSGQGGDRIRFVQLSQHLSFRQSRYPEGIQYLAQRGVHAAALIETRATPFSVRHNRLAYSISGMP